MQLYSVRCYLYIIDLSDFFKLIMAQLNIKMTLDKVKNGYE